MEHFIARYLNNDISDSDRKSFIEWTELSEENLKLYEYQKKLWDIAKPNFPITPFDTEKEWFFLEEKLVKHHSNLFKYFTAVASLAVCAVLQHNVQPLPRPAEKNIYNHCSIINRRLSSGFLSTVSN